mmetsp:Transcript_24263/g.82950  ORF Transcript_24263/g.82950 Transcript_24263/m.82950 type:complete len:356 (-) Transcript_24263:28-1095(-)
MAEASYGAECEVLLAKREGASVGWLVGAVELKDVGPDFKAAREAVESFCRKRPATVALAAVSCTKHRLPGGCASRTISLVDAGKAVEQGEVSRAIWGFALAEAVPVGAASWSKKALLQADKARLNELKGEAAEAFRSNAFGLIRLAAVDFAYGPLVEWSTGRPAGKTAAKVKAALPAGLVKPAPAKKAAFFKAPPAPAKAAAKAAAKAPAPPPPEDSRKKPRRAIVESDEDSDEDSDDDAAEAEAPPREAPRPPPPQVNGGKRLVEKTYKDGKGYLITAMVWVDEDGNVSAPAEAPAKAAAKPKAAPPKAAKADEAEAPKAKAKAEESKAPSKKPTKKAAAAKNQPSISSFFKKG